MITVSRFVSALALAIVLNTVEFSTVVIRIQIP